ncbi:MAG: sugar ABC transporter ATP-binding protein, partial [Ensifer adhaerens]
ALREKGLSLIVVSSEIEELVAYSTRVIVLRDRAHVAELDGGRITASEIVEAIAATNERRTS